MIDDIDAELIAAQIENYIKNSPSIEKGKSYSIKIIIQLTDLGIMFNMPKIEAYEQIQGD